MLALAVAVAGAMVAALFAVAMPASAAVTTPGVVLTAFPDRDFLNITGYPTTSPVTIDVLRNGTVVGTTGAVNPPAAGFDLNHGVASPVAGVDCWLGVTPDIIGNDVIRITKADGSTDTLTVANIKIAASKPFLDASNNVAIEGTATGADGVSPLASTDFGVTFRNQNPRLRPDDMPPIFQGASTSWRTTYTPPTDAERQIALNPDIGWRATTLAAANALTIAETNVANGPGAGCEAIAPADPNTLAAGYQNAVNLTSPDTVTLSGTARANTAAVTVNVGTLPQYTATVTPNATGPETWTLTVPKADLLTQPDGTISVTPTFDGISGTPRQMTKDMVAPLVPNATPAAGSYGGTQSVTLSKPAGEGTSKIYWETGATPTAAADPDQFSNLYTGQITVSATQTIKARVIDAAGNPGAIASLTYRIGAQPTTPTGVTATELKGGVRVNWTGVTGATGYNVYKVVGGAAAATPLNSAPLTATSFSDTGLVDGDYSYVVRAVEANGIESANSAIASATLAPPTVPVGLTAAAGNAQVTLNWTGASTDTANIKVYRNDAALTPLLSGAARSFTNTGLTNNTLYTYAISALDAAGNESAQTGIVQATPTAPLAAPPAPTGLTAASGNGQVVLNWAASNGAASYEIWRAQGTGATLTLTKISPTTPATVTGITYTDTTAVNGTTYTYAVKAVNSAGASGESNRVSATPTAPVTIPAAPTGLTATAGNNTVALNWTASTGAASYQVMRATGSGTLAPLAGATPTGTTFNDTTALNGTTYTYAVQAVNSAGASGNSTQVTASPSAPPTNPPASAGIALHGTRTVNPGTAATSVAIQAPVGVQTGDVMLAAVASRGAPTFTGPAGWTLVRRDANSTTMAQAVFQKVATASDTSTTSYSFTLSQSQVASAGIAAYGGVSTATPVDVSGGQANASATSVTAPSVTTTKANTQLVGFFGNATNTSFTAPAGMTERLDVASPSTATFKVTLEAADQAVGAAGATSTRVATSAVGSASIGQLVALAPSGAATGGTTTPAPTAPAAPTQLTATGANNSVSLTWTASTGATSYQVWRATGTGALAQLPNVAPTGTSFNDTTAVNGTTYTYAVRAVNSAGASGNSSTVTATPSAGTTTPPPPSTGIVLHGQRSVATTASGTSVAIQGPVGVQTGDVILAAVAARGAPTITAPTGWTLVRRDAQGTTMVQAVFRKVATASDTATTSYAFTLSSSQFATAGIAAYGGVSSAAPVDVSNGQINASSTTVTAPTVTTTKANTVLVGFFGTATNATFTPASGMTERVDVASPSTAGFRVAMEISDQARPTAGATGTRAATANLAAANVGQVVALAP